MFPVDRGLYPNSLACSAAADEVIGGALFEMFAEVLIAFPLLAAATTKLVSDKLEAPEFADAMDATLPKCSAV